MALTIQPVIVNAGSIYAVHTDAKITSETLTGSSGKLYKVEIDNTGNSVPVYVKLYDTTGGAAHGTDDPHWVFKCPATSSKVYTCANGNAFANGIKVNCTTEAGTGTTTSGTGADAASAVTYRILLG